MPRITKTERLPALPNSIVDDRGHAYQVAPHFPVNLRIAVRVADALLVRAQWRAERLQSADALYHYCDAADLGACEKGICKICDCLHDDTPKS